ncbi:hypothetical protein [Amycolatopsis sp. GM8]|uniref:Rv1733c family protein n=1 Tax=Amycolatopsis sp. GM8 TaxID=2896530 RepID=UPI001F1E23DE|nr:hypothetical protein [Amycolatopsis sp. GM8]
MNGRRWVACASGNPLVRTEDRIEATVLVLALLVVLAAVPFAFAFGSSTYAAQRESAVAAAADRHPASAVLLADAPPPLVTPQGVAVGAVRSVEASWRLPDGDVRTGVVSAAGGSAAGSTVQIWLDGNGNAVAAPPAPDVALVAAIAVAALGWLAVALVAGGMFWLVRLVLDRRRYARWELEWTHLPSHY